MKLSYLLLIALMAGLISCNWGVPKKQPSGIAKDTLHYTYETVKQRAADCGNKSDSNCTVAQIKYPVFRNAKLLNDSVKKKLTGLFEANKTDTSLQLMCANFLKAYSDFKKSGKQKDVYYTLNNYARVLRQDSSLTTLEVGGYKFQGGAHGANIVRFINWNTKENKYLLLSDILTNGYEEQLTRIGETIFRKDEKLSDTASLTKDYFFKGGKFALNNNFLITPLGIRFVYNIYEIKPYAAGLTDLFIPYTQIKTLLQPHTVVTQYIK